MVPDFLHFPHLLGKKVHLGITGSIAAYKALDLTREIIRSGLQVSASLTSAAEEFIRPLSFKALGVDPVFDRLFTAKSSTYAHLQPGQEAQALLIVPATANCIAKMAWGLADDMLSCQILSFPGPMLVAPAMNPNLWLAAATQDNVQCLRKREIEVLEPAKGDVACGEQGQGRLPDLEQIYFRLLRAVTPARLQGRRILVTMGPTREFWDPVRFWSNPSSGRMGSALVIAAWIQGADVHCVCGPHQEILPGDVHQYPVQTAVQMHEACLQLWPEMDIGCLAAAVCDFRPRSYGAHKFKKASLQEHLLLVEFEPNPDILQGLGQQKSVQQKLIGFAAETGEDLQQLAQQKLHKKNLDLIVANRINQPDSGFSSRTNQVLILDNQNRAQELPLLSKGEVAWKIWDWITSL